MPAPASMTGFGRAAGDCQGVAWLWELRSVNGRGLELRLRLPPGLDALEPALRQAAAATLSRGNVSAVLTLRRAEAAPVQVDAAVLDRVLALALDLAGRIPGAPPPRAEALLALPGVMRAAAAEEWPAALPAASQAGFAQALADLSAAREAEGGRLIDVLAGQLDAVAALVADARAQAADQPAQHRDRLRASLDQLLGATQIDPARLAQEVALLAGRSDVTEELDRLDAHGAAARAILAQPGPAGRRMEFLIQEFGREANTLAAKSASLALSGTALAMKAALERLREQVANLE